MIGSWSSKTFLRGKLFTSKRNLNDVVTLMYCFQNRTHCGAYMNRMYSNIQELTKCNHFEIIAKVVQNKFITFCETRKFGHPKCCTHGGKSHLFSISNITLFIWHMLMLYCCVCFFELCSFHCVEFWGNFAEKIYFQVEFVSYLTVFVPMDTYV